MALVDQSEAMSEYSTLTADIVDEMQSAYAEYSPKMMNEATHFEDDFAKSRNMPFAKSAERKLYLGTETDRQSCTSSDISMSLTHREKRVEEAESGKRYCEADVAQAQGC
ncbi:hypothetical protein DFH28DRAFT_1130538 [Melampsora americana]|nr:hypothetical protein DFH28DRAFT_1130538 [Melampsora americana]